MSKPSLLLVTHFFPSHGGGVEIVAGQLAARLADDFDIRWAAGRSHATDGVESTVERVPLSVWNGIERRTGVPIPLPSPRAIAKVIRCVRTSDVVWIHDLLYPVNLLTAIAARAMNRPMVVTVHVGPINYRNAVLRWTMAAAYKVTRVLLLRRAARVAFVSERVRDETVRGTWVRIPAFIPNGVDANVFRMPRPAERLDARRAFGGEAGPLLVFVGRFVERKGLDLIRQLAQQTPSWRWVLAGQGPIDPDLWNYDNVIVERELSGRSLAPLYGAADVLVLPSTGEGFPLVVIEALACGTRAIVDPSTAAGDRTASAWLETEPVEGSGALERWLGHLTAMVSQRTTADYRRELSALAATHWSWDRAADAYRSLLAEAAAD